MRSTFARWFASRRPIRKTAAPRARLGLDTLERRLTPAISANYSSGILSVIGDDLDNTISVGRDASGVILVNGGAVAIKGGTPTIANTSIIQVFGQAGNDTIALDEANGALPRSNLFGGAGNDMLIGGSGSDQIFGQAGDDVLFGMGGADFLFGGSDNDVLIGGDGEDQVFGESGDDRMIWNPGDATDLNEGGNGADIVEINGGDGAETFTTTANGTRVRFDRLNPAPFSIDIGTSESLIVNMHGGDDSFSATGNLAALISITVDGGAGNDTILGSNGADVLLGGDGNDFLDGQQGNDAVFLGAGDDVFQWDPGDGSDIVEGQVGADRLVFNGSAANESFEVSALGQRVRLTRNVASIVMDLNDIEVIDLNALGGTDTLIVNNLAGTHLMHVGVNLAGAIGGTTGDTQPDTIVVNGTDGIDTIGVVGTGSSVSVSGLTAGVTITNSEGANDSLVLNALGGNDSVAASSLPAGIIKLQIDGGSGNDTLLGSQGADMILGGAGNDFVLGSGGDDIAFLGADDDVFQWNAGGGNDTVEGQGGSDTLLFTGSSASENIDIVANGSRVILFRNVANVTMDLNEIENLNVRVLGGSDNVVVGDLNGTGVALVGIDLRGVRAGSDGAVDTITVNGSQGADAFAAAGDANGVTVSGLSTRINVVAPDPASDRLTLNGLAGDDVIDASMLSASGMVLTLNGGLGADVLIGGAGNDQIAGGDGNDFIFMGDGDDTFTWNPGDDNDTVEGQDGFDALVFNGANVAESIDIAAVGSRVRFTRSVANVVLDLNGAESITFNALGGTDVITVNDLSGTHVVEVNLNLAAVNGAGDGQADTVIVNGTSGNDAILAFGDAAKTSVVGLAARVNITGAEVTNDRLQINARGGHDVVDASGLKADAIQLIIDGGDGDDILIGGDGDDILLGGDGDDVLIGGPGNDILDGGSGKNILIQ